MTNSTPTAETVSDESTATKEATIPQVDKKTSVSISIPSSLNELVKKAIDGTTNSMSSYMVALIHAGMNAADKIKELEGQIDEQKASLSAKKQEYDKLLYVANEWKSKHDQLSETMHSEQQKEEKSWHEMIIAQLDEDTRKDLNILCAANFTHLKKVLIAAIRFAAHTSQTKLFRKEYNDFLK
jgi:septal ring factor EnvC (AmiA/AmiB activator)